VKTANETFDADYYRSHCGSLPYLRSTPEWHSFFRPVADAIVLGLAPRKAFDAGCAVGFLVEMLWDRGVEAHGRDISEFAISQIRPDVRPWCAIGSIADPIEGQYDLVLCIEVLEHMPAEDAVAAIRNITSVAPPRPVLLLAHRSGGGDPHQRASHPLLAGTLRRGGVRAGGRVRRDLPVPPRHAVGAVR